VTVISLLTILSFLNNVMLSRSAVG
jgi:hypothetical protein